ncbi:MAG: PorT family protein [Bacteroidetes bacterium]|nr:PorT family protein [Bacteroidota bacterium]
MKRFITTVLVLFLFLSLNAQRFGVQGGGMLSNMKWRNDYFTLNTTVKPGFLLGVTYDLPLKNTMALNFALNYKCVGAAFIDSTDLASVRLGYVNLDIAYDYIFDMNKYKLYAEGGGYFGYLVRAQSVWKHKDQDTKTENLNIGTNDSDDILPMDVGVTFGVGVYYGVWKFGIGYQSSIINLSPDKNHVLRNQMGFLRATYFFGNKK